MKIWTQRDIPAFSSRFEWFEKKRKRELAAVQKNAKTFFAALQMGTRPMQIKFGFVHAEPMDVYAVDQGGGNLRETRLYLYPDVSEAVLYQLLIGEKDTQPKDIQFCKDWVVAFQLERKHTNAQDEGNGPGP